MSLFACVVYIRRLYITHNYAVCIHMHVKWNQNFMNFNRKKNLFTLFFSTVCFYEYLISLYLF